jgi:hypothetical protein
MHILNFVDNDLIDLGSESIESAMLGAVLVLLGCRDVLSEHFRLVFDAWSNDLDLATLLVQIRELLKIVHLAPMIHLMHAGVLSPLSNGALLLDVVVVVLHLPHELSGTVVPDHMLLEVLCSLPHVDIEEHLGRVMLLLRLVLVSPLAWSLKAVAGVN